ncbi:MAG: hypothetical protein KAR42_06970 [candidate division Zixibacteria bacterium]|nr:hypothetical protein [candidate division Zixibacteria bacterium]
MLNFLRTFLFVFIMVSSVMAADGQELFNAFQRICNSETDTTQTYRIKDAVISHQDIVLHLKHGALCFIKPVKLGDSSIVYGAYFDGRGVYQIAPTERIARQQVKHTFNTVKIKKSINRALLFFSPEIYTQLKAHCGHKIETLAKSEQRYFRKSWKHINKKESHYYPFEILRNIYESSDRAFLFINLQEHSLSMSDYYLYNPLDAEEIKIYKNKVKGPMFKQYMYTISSYSCLLDSTGTKCRIVSEPQIKTLHSNIDTEISDLGIMTTTMNSQYEVLKPPSQLIWMIFHDEMFMDSIIDNSGRQIKFIRHTKDSNKSNNLFLIMNQPAKTGDTLNLTYYYHGEALVFSGRRIINQSGSNWYPTYVERDSSTYDITYHVPHYSDMEFTATGTKLQESIDDHRITSIWKTETPIFILYFDYEEK